MEKKPRKPATKKSVRKATIHPAAQHVDDAISAITVLVKIAKACNDGIQKLKGGFDAKGK